MGGAFAQEPTAVKHTSLKLYADRDALVPGATVRIAIEQTIADGWHTYWVNPGDSGEAMQVAWTLPEGYRTSDFLWPAPDRVPYATLVNFGYTEQAIILSDLVVPPTAQIGQDVTITGKARVLVCDEVCIPEAHDIALTLPVAETAKPANADMFTAAVKTLPIVVDWPTITEHDANQTQVRITLPDSMEKIGRTTDDIVWFPYEWGYIDNASDQTSTYNPETRVLTLSQASISDRDLTQLPQASYLLRFQDEAYIVSGPLRSSVKTGNGLDNPSFAEAEAAQLGLPLILLFAFLGGLILNLMPCVFPILSMKALHLVSLNARERKHARAEGLSYGAGVVAMFLVLAAVLYAIRATGQNLGWGFQLQNPVMVAALAWLMFVIGLNLIGAFDLRVAFGGKVLVEEKHHPLIAAFLTGVLATLVATPCSAPFMATALGVALVQPVPIALGVFAMVGVGLATPYVVLCFAPMLQRALPKPGAWMETFRQILAFPMFATAVWLVWVVALQGAAEAVLITLTGMVMLAFAIWLLDRRAKKGGPRRAVTVVGMGIILGTIALLTTIEQAEPVDQAFEAQNGHANYEPFDVEQLDHALRDGDRPVFVNMTAAWCITCLVNEKVALNTDEVRSIFADHNVLYFKGDWTNQDPAITAYLQSYGRSGVPIYVFYGAPDPETGKRPDPVVLPQILTAQVIRDTVQNNLSTIEE